MPINRKLRSIKLYFRCPARIIKRLAFYDFCQLIGISLTHLDSLSLRVIVWAKVLATRKTRGAGDGTVAETVAGAGAGASLKGAE